MEAQAIVEAPLHQLDDVLDGLGSVLGEGLELDRAFRGVQHDDRAGCLDAGTVPASPRQATARQRRDSIRTAKNRCAGLLAIWPPGSALV